MSFKRYRIIFILIFMLCCSFGEQTTKQHMTNGMENVQTELFPRMEFSNEWKPVGRGDPLKDPTYDYMPPVLDRVRYWAEGTSHKNKNEILLLGVPSKKSPSIKQKDKYTYGPIRRTYYSSPYQSHFSPPLHQQQYLPQRLMPPPKHETDSYSMSTHHHQHHSQQQHHGWKTSNNVNNESRPENSINHVRVSRPTMSRTPGPFLPTIPPADRLEEPSSTSPTWPMSTQTTVKYDGPAQNGHMMPSKVENFHKDTTKPLLQSILRTETASPFTKRPSSMYPIEYTRNIYNPEAINSMASSSSHETTFTPTKPTIRPMSWKTTTKTSLVPLSSPTTATASKHEEENQYVQPEMHFGWPVYNLIIEGHSKVKTYGLKNDDIIESNLPKIRPIIAKENPIVERVTHSDEGPEFHVKHLSSNQKGQNKLKKPEEDKKSAMTSLLSLLNSSFGNFLSDESIDNMQYESENKIKKNEKGNSEKHKERRSIPDDENSKQEKVFSVSFKVDGREGNVQKRFHRKGTVISDKLWPLQTVGLAR